MQIKSFLFSLFLYFLSLQLISLFEVDRFRIYVYIVKAAQSAISPIQINAIIV